MGIISDAISGQQNDPTAQALGAAAAPAAAPAPSLANPTGALPTTGLPPTSTTPSPGPANVAQVGAPNTWNVTPDQTVEGRIQSILATNNPIIQSARTRALETANGRGLLNSSMAVQAGEQAAQQAALPIAQADAATAAKAASYNADEPNQVALKNVDAQNQRGLQQLQMENSKLLQTNNQAATAFNQALVAIANINQNDKMDANAKTQAIAQIQAQLQAQLKTLGATTGLDLTSQLNFAGSQGFDASGNFVGFDGGNTAGAPGSSAAPAPPVAPPGVSQGVADAWFKAYGQPAGSAAPAAQSPYANLA